MSRGTGRTRRQNRRNYEEDKMAKNLDDLDAFDQFRRDILPALRKQIADGASAEDVYRAYEAHLAARAITIALTETDSARALAAVKEALDRGKGKAVERQEHTHKYEKLKDEELDSLLLSKLDEDGASKKLQ